MGGQKIQLDMGKHGNKMITVNNSEKCNLLKRWRHEYLYNEKYLEAKKKASKAIYQAKCEAEKNRFTDVSRRDDQKCEVFKTAK